MKKTALLPVLVAVLLSFSASAARAASFTLTMVDLGLGAASTVVVADNSLGGVPGTGMDEDGALNSIIYSGEVGNFSIMFTTGSVLTNASGPGVPAQMLLHSFLVSTNLDNGRFLATLFANDLSSAQLGAFAQASVQSSVAFSNATGTVRLTNSVDPSDMPFPQIPPPASTITQLTSVSINNAPGLSDPFALAGMFSLYSTIEMNFVTKGSVTADTGMQIINPIGTPEPGTMMLFGTGLGVFGLASFGRRHSKKGAA